MLALPAATPALNRLTDYLGSDNEAPQPTFIGGSMGFRSPAETMSTDGVRRRDYLPGLNNQNANKFTITLFIPICSLSYIPTNDDSHALAWNGRPNGDRLRMVLSFRGAK